jgi:STE24 endopeptidase
MSDFFFYIILSIIAIDYLLERFLDYLNMTMMSEELPEELRGIYDPDRYKKSQQYLRAKQRFSFITATVNFAAVGVMLSLGGWTAFFAE